MTPTEDNGKRHGPRPELAELLDRDWVREQVGELGHREATNRLIELLGCSRGLAYAALRRAGLGRYSQWSQLEDLALRNFYVDYDASLVAEALGRSRSAVYARALKGLGLKKGHRGKRGEAVAFWRGWRKWLMRRFAEWVGAGVWTQALELVWCPAEGRESCNGECPSWNICTQDLRVPLPCEKVTVGDIVRFVPAGNEDAAHLS